MNTLGEAADRAARNYAARCWWADIDDLRQEAWVAVLSAQRTFKPDRGVPLPWYAFRAAVLALRTFTWRTGSPVYAPIKKLPELAGLTRDEVDLSIPGDTEDVGDQLHCARASRELVEQVQHILSRGRHGVAVQMVLMDGEPPEQVAWKLGIPVTRIWKATDTAKRRLREDKALRRLMRK